MPHVSGGGGGGDDLGSKDEIKVFQHEGDEGSTAGEEEILKEDKTSLITEGEEKSVQIPTHSFLASKNAHLSRADLSSLAGKPFEYLPPTPFGYVVSPYHPHANGALGALSMETYLSRLKGISTKNHEGYEKASRVPVVPPNHAPSPLSLMMYNADAFQPPPAHMGIPPVHIDPKTGIPRPPVYPLPPPGQYHPVFSPDFTQQFQWHASSMYPMASTFRPPPYPGTLPLSSPNLPNKFSPPTLIPPHPGIPTSVNHHPLLGPGPKIEMPDSQDSRYLCNFSPRHLPSFNHNHHTSNNSSSNQPNELPNANNISGNSSRIRSSNSDKKKSHIKKPLNAFMLYMKEMRSKVVAECTLKESAAINQILGRRWHNLSRDEQSKYYEMARKERQLHMQLYPGWTARDNYAINAKKKKRKRDKSQEGDGNNPKKCRARFGLDQQSSWCKPCRRKKKCIRYTGGSDNTGESEDNVGSVGSVGSLEAPTPDSRFGVDAAQITDDDDDSGNGDVDDELEVSSEFSLSSPSVPRPIDGVQSVLENGRLPMGSPPSQQIHHPLNVQHLSRTSRRPVPDSPDAPDLANVSLPQLPTPPSTDSSTTTTAPPLLAVT